MSAYWGDLFGDLIGPAKVLSIALIGLVLANFLFHEEWYFAISLVAAAVVLAFIFESIGSSLLPKHPRLGLLFLEAWVVAPAAIAALASALVVFVAVVLAVPQKAQPETQEMIKALSAALTAFISGSFVSWIGEQNNTKMSNRIKRRFFEKYKRAKTWPLPSDGTMYFVPSSVGENLVYSEEYAGAEGWSFNGRWKRATLLEEEIRSGSSQPVCVEDIVIPQSKPHPYADPNWRVIP